MTPLFTVGHGTRSTEDLAACVRASGARILVDIRRYPRSRRNPHLAGAALARGLPTLGVAYEWWGESLGGRRRASRVSRHPALRSPALRAYADHMDTAVFRAALTAVVDREETVVVMCAETLWWRCHRRLVADAAVLRGVEVVHVMGQGETQPHRLTAGVRAGDDGWPVYDGSAPALFPPPAV